MSQLVPVLEVMHGVTGHRLPFKVGCQAQLFKKNKSLSLKPLNRTENSYDLGFTEWYVVLHDFVNKNF